MCMGLPMQVYATEPGHALCEGRGERRRVRTALVGQVAVGDWLLVFLDSAQEMLSVERAREIASTLDLLAAAMSGGPPGGEAGFALPSHTDFSQLLALSGRPLEREMP